MGLSPELKGLQGPAADLDLEIAIVRSSADEPPSSSANRLPDLISKQAELYRLDERLTDLGATSVELFPGGYSYALPPLADHHQQFLEAHPDAQDLSPAQCAERALTSSGFSSRGAVLADYILSQGSTTPDPAESEHLASLIVRSGSTRAASHLLAHLSSVEAKNKLVTFLIDSKDVREMTASLERVSAFEVKISLVRGVCESGDGLQLLQALDRVSEEPIRELIVDRLLEASQSESKSEPSDFFLSFKILSSKVEGRLLGKVIDEYERREDPDLAQLALKYVTDPDRQVKLARKIVEQRDLKAAAFALRNELCDEVRGMLEAALA
jgi:hypothetical protein